MNFKFTDLTADVAQRIHRMDRGSPEERRLATFMSCQSTPHIAQRARRRYPDGGPGEDLVRGRVKARRKILHHGRDAAAAPALGEDEESQQKLQRVPNIECDRGNARAVGAPPSSGESPSAEARHNGDSRKLRTSLYFVFRINKS